MNPEPAMPGMAEDEPAVVVHGLAHLRLAMEAAERSGRRSLLVASSADAGCFMGPAWWLALIRLGAGEARSLVPGAAPGLLLHDLLDCGDAAGWAMETLRLGGRGLILAATCPQRGAVLERAAMLGARVLAARPAVLDLAERGAERRLDAWLAPRPSSDKAGPVG